MMKLFQFFLITICLLGIGGCKNVATSAPPVEFNAPPAPTPLNFNEVLRYIGNGSAEERIIGMWFALDYPSEYPTTIPLIIENLVFHDDPEVRSAAARTLGEIGRLAKQAVPDLLKALETDVNLNVRIDIAIALGKIGDKKAVPSLASNLCEYRDEKVAVFSAKSISQITGEIFSDSNSSGYRVAENGIPLIVTEGCKWWQEEGQFEDWSDK